MHVRCRSKNFFFFLRNSHALTVVGDVCLLQVSKMSTFMVLASLLQARGTHENMNTVAMQCLFGKTTKKDYSLCASSAVGQLCARTHAYVILASGREFRFGRRGKQGYILKRQSHAHHVASPSSSTRQQPSRFSTDRTSQNKSEVRQHKNKAGVRCYAMLEYGALE